MPDQIAAAGQSAALDANAFTAPSGCAFAGWTTSITGPGTSYADQAVFSMGSGDATLYAIWLPSTLSFDSSGNAIVVTGCATKPTGEFAIPFGVTSIGEAAFQDCEDLRSVAIPASVSVIGAGAFLSCEKLARVTIALGVTSIYTQAFGSCVALTSVTIPASVTRIQSSLFSGSRSLTSIQVEADNPKYSSESGILFDKAKTTLLVFPEGKDSDSYEIPAGVTSIGDNAFMSCNRLASLTIPSSVASIKNTAISNSYSLLSIYVLASSPPELGSGNFGGLDPAFVIYVPSASLSAYQIANNWSSNSGHMQGY